MRILSLNVGRPRKLVWQGRTITTGIVKTPVDGRLALRRHNLDGDRQADLRVHGGEKKAVYCYPLAHYELWQRELDRFDLVPGIFGENFTLDGALEAEVFIGDHYQVGSAEVVVTQPRQPCYKLAARFEDDDMIKRFLLSGRPGFYVGVVREGEVGPGDEMTLVSRDANAVSVADIMRLFVGAERRENDDALIARALQSDVLPRGWKTHIKAHLQPEG